MRRVGNDAGIWRALAAILLAVAVLPMGGSPAFAQEAPPASQNPAPAEGQESAASQAPADAAATTQGQAPADAAATTQGQAPAEGQMPAQATQAEGSATDEASKGGKGDNKEKDKDKKKPQVTPAVVKKVHASVRFVGTDGEWAHANNLELPEGSTAWDATRLALTKSEFAYRTGTSATDDILVTLTRKRDGFTLGLDPATGSGWHLYINGEHYQGSSSTPEVAEGDQIEWRYEVGTVTVSVSVVGPGGEGDSYWVEPTNVKMNADQTAWDASLQVFAQNGYREGRLLSFTQGGDGSVWLESLAALGENGITGESWLVFINGVAPATDVAHVRLNPGDSICWYYAGRGVTELPPFVSKTGAASQSPAESVAVEGKIVQAWSLPAVRMLGVTCVVDGRAGVATLGGENLATLVCTPSPLSDPTGALVAGSGWSTSLGGVLDRKLRTGEGVRAVLEGTGDLFYLNGEGKVVALELQRP